MAVGLYLDVHVDHAIAAQLRLRSVDVITAQEDGADTLPDEQLLERASQLGRPLMTHDIRFCAMVENWQPAGRAFCGAVQSASWVAITRNRCPDRLLLL